MHEVKQLNIGFIGLGNMGYPMATRLVQAGYKLTVMDLNDGLVQKFCSDNLASSTQSLEELGENNQVVISMLPDGNAVRNVIMKDGGVSSGMNRNRSKNGDDGDSGRERGVIIDMSSSSPVGTRALSAELLELGIDLIDAPVSGGVAKATDGSLAIMVGGEAGVVDEYLPILEVLGKVFKTGASASGHAMKAMNNFMSAASLAVTAEAVILGEKFGLDPKVIIETVNASSGRSNSSEHKFPAFILPKTFDSGFFLGLMAKDLRLARELADAEETPSELLRQVCALWSDAEESLGYQADNTEIVKYLEAQLKK